jgi:phosphatidylserine/phosphatidylglycerophosphate/cardiolipin synthase-like enzyme
MAPRRAVVCSAECYSLVDNERRFAGTVGGPAVPLPHPTWRLVCRTPVYGAASSGVFDTDPADVAAIAQVFNADYAHTSIVPSDGDDLVRSPTDSQSQLLALINGAQHSLDIEQEEFDDAALVNAIVAAENRGVTVRVVLETPAD